MKKKQTNKKNTSKSKSKKKILEPDVFDNLDKKTPIIVNKNNSSSGIPKYVADRMARRIFLLHEYLQF